MTFWSYLSSLPWWVSGSALIGSLITGLLIRELIRSKGYRHPESEWMTDRRNPLGAAADPLHFTPRSLSDQAAKGMRKAQQRIVP